MLVIADTVAEAFGEKLQVILERDQPPPATASAEELGVDSLVAVEIRSWFMKQLSIDLPVLEILGGAALSDMVDFAAKKLPAELTPALDRTGLEENVSATVLIADDDAVSSESNLTSSDTLGESLGTTPPELVKVENTPSELGKPRIELMSYGQTRFWFLRAYLEDQNAFNVRFKITLSGYVDSAALSKTVDIVARKHASLRTRFLIDEQGQAAQEILPEPIIKLETRKISDEQDVETEYERMKTHTYDLESGENMSIQLLSTQALSHSLVIGYHHINMDGLSLRILLDDLDKVYRGGHLDTTVLQYPDFAVRQRQQVTSGYMDADLSFWRNEFSDFPPVLPLLPFSTAISRKPLKRYTHNTAEMTLDRAVAAKIKAACASNKVTTFNFFLSTFQALLSRLLDVQDLCIGIADANRTEIDQQNSIGMFVNLLPLRFRKSAGQRFNDALKESHSKVRGALAHCRLPFDVLIEALNPPRSDEYSPLFQCFVDYQPPIDHTKSFLGCRVGGEKYDRGNTAYDVNLGIMDATDGAALITMQTQSSLYSQSDTEVLLKSYIWLLEQFSDTPEVSLDDVSLFNPADVNEAIQLGTGQ